MAGSGNTSRVLIPCVTPVKPFYLERGSRKKQVQNYLYEVCNVTMYV